MNNKEKINETYKKISIKLGLGVEINPELCFYNPRQVVESLKNNSNVKKWLNYISNHYLPEKKDILLIYPCSTVKPYPVSRSYKILNRTFASIDSNRKKIHLITISEPFGLVPEEYYGIKTEWHNWENDWYDCPGLFEWWCNKYNFEYDQSLVDEALDILSNYIANFFINVDKNNCYRKKIALVRTFTSNVEKKNDHTHRRMLEQAIEKSGTEIEIIPTKDMVSQIVSERGAYAWDMWGVAHPLMQNILISKIEEILKE